LNIYFGVTNGKRKVQKARRFKSIMLVILLFFGNICSGKNGFYWLGGTGRRANRAYMHFIEPKYEKVLCVSEAQHI
jgi:hypothetical protein